MTHSPVAGSAAGPAAASSAGAGRILFVDLARAVAVLLMVQGHTIDALLHPDFRTSLQYNGWLYLRGLTSCTFLFLSGAAFSLTALRHWEDQGRFSRRSFKRVRRLAFFLGLGYFVKFPMGRFLDLPFANDERWRSFFAVDVLQNVAITLLALQVLIAPDAHARGASPSPAACWPRCSWASRRWRTASCGPTTCRSSRRRICRTAPASLFPLFPWAGFTLLGAAFGVTAAPWATRDHLQPLARALS